MRIAAACALPFAFLACQPVEDAEVTYHRDVQPILEARCVHCHTEGQIGPMALDSYEQASTFAEAIAQATEDGSMPPFLADPSCADYDFDPSLTDEQVGVLRAWADLGAPEGSPDDPGEPAVGIESLDLDRFAIDPDVVLEMPEPYEPQVTFGDDDYRCFVLDWPYDEPTFVTGFTPQPGNDRLVHHVIAYLVPPEDAEELLALDEAEPGPGYTCFGGPGLRRPEWIGGWAPGGQGGAYPEGTGLRVEPGSKVALQVHYHLENGTGEDLTTIELSTADEVERQALILPFTNPLWLQGEGMLIPAGEADVSHTFSVDVAEMMDEPEDFYVYSANLHMHELGRAGTAWIDRADGTRECLLDIPQWNFEWQLSYGFEEPKVVGPGDVLNLECRWDNSGASHDHSHDDGTEGPHDVVWGDGTGDEMCLAIFYVSEK